MPFPPGLTLITVTGTIAEYPAGGVASGSISFTTPAWLTSSVDDAIVPKFTKTVPLAADGTFTVALPATNDPGWTPQGWSYAVSINAGGQVQAASLQLPYDGGPVNLADVLVTTAPTAGTTYATLAQLAGVMKAFVWNGTVYVPAVNAGHYVGPNDPGAVPEGSVWDQTP